MKWRFGFLVILLLCVPMLPLMAGAEIVDSGICGDNLTWTIDSTGLLTISGVGDMYNYTEYWEDYGADLPDEDEHYDEIPVQDSENILAVHVAPWGDAPKKLLLSPGITSIGDSAFAWCNNIENVSIPESVTKIGSYSFAHCTSLANISIPESVKAIGISAFTGDYKLKSINIPDGLEHIGNNAFSNCNSLTSVIIPDSVTIISENVFGWCSNLTSILIPDSVTSIGDSAFSGCTSLTSITIPDSVTSIGTYAFSGCASLTGIMLPDSVTSIGNGTISGCASLTSITIPDSIISIGGSAFSGCTGLTSITIPDSVTSIGGSAFSGCTGLRFITIPDSVASIEARAFSNCTGLTSITIPDGVTSIGEFAFSGCSNLTSITIGSGVTRIGGWAFGSDYGLRSVYFNVSSEDATITFGPDLFSSMPTIYCHMFTAPHTYFVNAGGYNVVLLEDVDIDTIRSITLPNDFRMACGDCVALSYSVFPADDASITWTSSDPELLTVANGVVTALKPGIVTVTAAIGLVSESVTIETYVPASSLILNHTEAWLQAARENIQLEVSAYIPENASATVTWKSSSTIHATVDENGNVTTIKPGEVTITATTEKGVTADCVLRLCYPVSSVTLSSPASAVYIYETMQLTATVVTSKETFTNKLVTFTSSDEAIATVDANGLVTAVFPGMATITAASANGKSDFVEVTVQCASHIPEPDTAVAPTCTESGLTEGSHCSLCGKVLVAQEVVPPLGHDLIHHEAQAATCTEIGWDAYESCTRCEYTTYAEIPALGHELVQHEAKDATCEEIGWNAYETCSRCDYTTYTEIAALGHNLVQHEAQAATCTEKGWNAYETCSRCDYTTYVEIPALGHDWGPWTVTKQPTCEVPGENTRTCKNDNSHIENRDIDLLSHAWVTTWEKPQCVRGSWDITGYFFTQCTYCGKYTTQIDADALIDPDDTQVSEDYVQVTLNLWEYNQLAETYGLPVTDGHDWTDWIYTAPTCRRAGYKWHWCTRCDMEVQVDLSQEELQREEYAGWDTPSDEHVWTDWIFVNTPDPVNRWERRCTNCGMAQTYFGVHAPGAHVWGDTAYQWACDNSTVTAVRTCTLCSFEETETVTVTAAITSPTMTARGKASYTSAAFENQAFTVQRLEILVPSLRSLQLLNLPAQLTAIEEEAFAGAAFEAVIIPDGCTFIGSRAFADCPNLIYVRIPASVTSIAEDAFEGCDQVVIDRAE